MSVAATVVAVQAGRRWTSLDVSALNDFILKSDGTVGRMKTGRTADSSNHHPALTSRSRTPPATVPISNFAGLSRHSAAS